MVNKGNALVIYSDAFWGDAQAINIAKSKGRKFRALLNSMVTIAMEFTNALFIFAFCPLTPKSKRLKSPGRSCIRL
jgi:hypothetical protein